MSENGKLDGICWSCRDTISVFEFNSTCPSCGDPYTLNSRYLFVAEIGHGSFGDTFKARDLRTDQSVAIKELPIRRINDPKTMELFDREASMLQRIKHSNVPDYIEHFIAGEGRTTSAYLIQEFIEGETLAERKDGISIDEALERIASIAQTLAEINEVGLPIVHRDIKPNNIMCSSDGRTMLIDFGSVADALKPAGAQSTVAGTFGYMAPEQFRPFEEATPSLDVYALGVVMVELLSGRPPESILNFDNRIEWEEHAENFPTKVVDLLRDMLAIDANDRPSLKEVATRLREVDLNASLIQIQSKTLANYKYPLA